MQAVIYVRISRDREGAGLGVERQRDDCAELAARLGWTVVATYSDNDVSAYSGKRRPGYEQMLADIEAGRAQAILAWHADRLHRRPIELESFIDLCDRRQIQVQTVKSGTVDLSTPSGKMVARMLGAAARHEVEHSVERAKRAKEQAALAGKYRGGRRSFGYEKDGMTARPEEADAIRTAAEQLLAGVSLSQITRNWNAAGLRTSYGGQEFRSVDIRKILLRPRNAGVSLHDGKPVADGQWEAIVDRDTFAAVTALLRTPGRTNSPGFQRKHQGSGIYRCGVCGATLIGALHNRTADGYRQGYTCSKSKHLMRDVEHLDAYVDAVVLDRLSRPDAALSLGDADVDGIARLRTRRDGIRARLDELSLLFAEGSIDGPQLKSGSTDLRQQLEAVESQLAAARASAAVADVVLAGDDLAATWARASAAIRGKVIDALATVVVMPAGRGRKAGGGYFDPSAVQIEWRNNADELALPPSRAPGRAEALDQC